MNFMPQLGVSSHFDTNQQPFFIPSPRPQRRHTIVDHFHFQENDGSGSLRSGLNDIHMGELGRSKRGHSRNPSNATDRHSSNYNISRININNNNNNSNNNNIPTNHDGTEGDPQHPLLLSVPGDDQDRASSYGKTLLESLPPEHDCEFEGCERVTINVSGLKFETQIRTLERLPNTLLGNPEKRMRYWDEDRHEFFFDRHRPTFQAVLYYYQSGGRLKKPLEVPMDIFLNELHFYELGGPVIECFKENEGYIMDNDKVVLPTQKWMRVIWETLEYPESSLVAKLFALASICFIVTSVVSFCVETLPQFKDNGCKNVTVVDEEGNEVEVSVTEWNEPLFMIESTCIAFFVMELALRFVSCPSKVGFFKMPINLIDLLAITPYFVFLVINFLYGSCGQGHTSSVLSVLRVIRVVRILKLSKHSQGLKILGKTFKTSIRELSMFILFLGIATIIFAGAIFYAEMNQAGSMFESIPDAFWWAIVTMTTVGYGDYVPVGVLGKILGGMCVLSGVLAIALPVPVIVANFNKYYRHYTGRRGKSDPIENIKVK